jgi:hypothetical protein
MKNIQVNPQHKEIISGLISKVQFSVDVFINRVINCNFKPLTQKILIYSILSKYSTLIRSYLGETEGSIQVLAIASLVPEHIISKKRLKTHLASLL